MPDNKSLNLSQEDRAAAIEEASKLLSSISFMRSLLSEGKFNSEEAACHLSLMRHGYDGLARLFGMDLLSKDLDKAYAMLRDANGRVSELEAQLGQGTTAAAAAARLSQLEDWFCTWYQLSGFHYMTLKYNKYGLSFETSDEIEHPPVTPEDIHFGDRALAVKIAPVVPYAFGDFDKKKDTFHDNLYDTQKNHDAMLALFAQSFPGVRFHGFRSHTDGPNEFMLRAEGFVPWEDIEKWHGRIVKTAEETAGRNTGKLYVRIAELAGRLSNRTYTSHAGTDMVKADRAELARIRTIARLWDQVTDLRLKDGMDAEKTSEKLDLEYDVQENERHGHTFKKGTRYASIEKWFADTFGLDVAKDLVGEKEACDAGQ